MIFNTFQELKDYAGGQVNVGVELNHLTAAYRAARDNHLERYLGDAFLDDLEAKAKPDPGTAPTDKEVGAIKNVSRALALLTLYEWTFTSGVQMGPNGLVRYESDKVKGAYKFQTNEYRRWSLAAGLNALDAALRYCDINAASLPVWDGSEAAEYHRAVLIRSYRTLRRVHNQPADRHAYEALRPLMADLQEFVFVELIGREQLNRLIDRLSVDQPSAEERKLIALLRRSLAAFAVNEALKRNVVELVGGRILQTEALEPQSTEKTSNPTMATVDVSIMQNKEFAERHLSAVREFLKTNGELFPLYLAWLDINQPDADILYPTEPTRRTGGKVVRL